VLHVAVGEIICFACRIVECNRASVVFPCVAHGRKSVLSKTLSLIDFVLSQPGLEELEVAVVAYSDSYIVIEVQHLVIMAVMKARVC
jgi:hypothetical protein